MKALLTAVCLVAFSTFAMANVSTQGTGKVTYVPDVGYVQFGVQGEGATAAEAWEKNREAVKKIFEALRKLGIDPKDMQTTNLNVSPKYHTAKDKPPVLVGYVASYDLKITVRKLNDMGKVLDDVVEAGANRNMSIGFGCSNVDKLMDEARKKAVLDARKRAQLYATTAGAGLGQVVSISDHTDYPHYRLAYEHAPMSGAKGLDIAVGSQELSVNVNIVYSLVPQQLPPVLPLQEGLSPR